MDHSRAQTPPARLRPGAGRLMVIILIGPLVGALVYAGIAVLSSLHEEPGDTLALAGLMLGFGWMFGFVPAVLSALAVRLLGLSQARPRRWLEAAGIGALSALLALPAILPTLFGIAIPPLDIIALFGLCGAVAFCATALPGLRAA